MKDVLIDQSEGDAVGLVNVELDHYPVRIACPASRDSPISGEVGCTLWQVSPVIDVKSPLARKFVFAGIEKAESPFNSIAVFARGIWSLGLTNSAHGLVP